MPEGTFKHVQCFGLHGTYDDGLEWLQRKENASRSKVVLSLGSSIGNFTRPEAAAFVKQFAEILSPSDRLLIGVDACQEPEKVYHAYNDSEGITNEFTLNGLRHANKLLGHTAFDLADWDAIGHYDEQDGRHQAFVSPKREVRVEGVIVHAGEKIRIEESYKSYGRHPTSSKARAGQTTLEAIVSSHLMNKVWAYIHIETILIYNRASHAEQAGCDVRDGA